MGLTGGFSQQGEVLEEINWVVKSSQSCRFYFQMQTHACRERERELSTIHNPNLCSQVSYCFSIWADEKSVIVLGTTGTERKGERACVCVCVWATEAIWDYVMRTGEILTWKETLLSQLCVQTHTNTHKLTSALHRWIIDQLSAEFNVYNQWLSELFNLWKMNDLSEPLVFSCKSHPVLVLVRLILGDTNNFHYFHWILLYIL